MLKKGINVIVLFLDYTLCLLMLHFLTFPCFPFLLLLLVGGHDDLLLYIVSSPTPTPAPVLVKPPIT